MFKIFAAIAFFMPLFTTAQMKFRSVGTTKPIAFTFGFQHPKGAFVWYKGQKEPIPLKLKTSDVDSSERESGQPDFHTYRFTEMYKGKATGEYGITEWPRNVDDIYYIRFKDGKKFKFDLIKDDEFYDGKEMVLLKDIKVYYNAFYDDNLIFVYPDGSKVKFLLNHLDKNQARRIGIKDYNFDGIDDISFETSNGNIQNLSYDVFIYNPSIKKFTRLKEPNNTGCGLLNNLKVDQANKWLITKCKRGARLNSFIYKFNPSGELILVK
ncbi:XAC2610-related protein [Pedobacter terrae]|uniref:XAC2610-related protein n=1 Tax=Pedobacter terrae TaxID=405671 RepID=UPI002FF87520